MKALQTIVIPNCGHCNSEAIGGERVDSYYLSSNSFSKAASSRYIAIYKCQGCGLYVSAYGIPGANLPSDFEIKEFFPKPNTPLVNKDLPQRAQTYLLQAKSTVKFADASVMACASSVDAMLKEKGYASNESLFKRINKAAEDGVITAAMKDWFHHIRLEANDPRHADSDDPHKTEEEAQHCIRFAEALGQFLFELPALIERGTNRAKETKKSDITSENKTLK